MGKAKKAGMSKLPVKTLKIKGKKFFIDISYPSTISMGCKKHWLLVLEDSIDYAWSYFLKEKSELEDIMLIFLKYLKSTQGINVRYTNCNNASENESFESVCKQEGMVIEFEYTVPGTPQ